MQKFSGARGGGGENDRGKCIDCVEISAVNKIDNKAFQMYQTTVKRTCLFKIFLRYLLTSIPLFMADPH